MHLEHRASSSRRRFMKHLFALIPRPIKRNFLTYVPKLYHIVAPVLSIELFYSIIVKVDAIKDFLALSLCCS